MKLNAEKLLAPFKAEGRVVTATTNTAETLRLVLACRDKIADKNKMQPAAVGVHVIFVPNWDLDAFTYETLSDRPAGNYDSLEDFEPTLGRGAYETVKKLLDRSNADDDDDDKHKPFVDSSRKLVVESVTALLPAHKYELGHKYKNASSAVTDFAMLINAHDLEVIDSSNYQEYASSTWVDVLKWEEWLESENVEIPGSQNTKSAQNVKSALQSRTAAPQSNSGPRRLLLASSGMAL